MRRLILLLALGAVFSQVFGEIENFDPYRSRRELPPENPCSVCNNYVSNRCTVYEEFRSHTREQIINVKCFDGNVFVGERNFTTPNASPGKDLHRIYSQTVQNYEEDDAVPQTKSHRSSHRTKSTSYNTYSTGYDPCGICQPSSAKIWATQNDISNSFFQRNYLPDDHCSFCQGTRANTCSVKEETSSNIQYLTITVTCLENNQYITENQFTKPNPFPNQIYQRYYTKSFRSSTSQHTMNQQPSRTVERPSKLVQTNVWNQNNGRHAPDQSCSVCEGTGANSCVVSEDSSSDLLNLVVLVKCQRGSEVLRERTLTRPSPHPGNQVHTVYTQSFSTRTVDNYITRPEVHKESYRQTSSSYQKGYIPINEPTDNEENVCRVCERYDSNTCSVKEETGLDTRYLQLTIKCYKNDRLVYSTNQNKVNPNPGSAVKERWYSQSVSKISSSQQTHVTRHHTQTETNNVEHPLKSYCQFCETIREANKCTVRDETSPDGQNIIVIVKCLRDDSLIRDKTYTKYNPNPGQHVSRWYSQSTTNSFQINRQPANDIHTTLEIKKGQSISIDPTNPPVSSICAATCGTTSAKTCYVQEQTPSYDRRILVVTVECKKEGYAVSRKQYRRPNPNPTEYVNRWYDEPIRQYGVFSLPPTFIEMTGGNYISNQNSQYEHQQGQYIVNQHNSHSSQSHSQYIANEAQYEADLLNSSCIICDGTNAQTCAVDEETSLDKESLITVVKCLDASSNVITERTYYKPNKFPNQQIKRTFSRTFSRTITTHVVPMRIEHTSNSRYENYGSHQSLNQYGGNHLAENVNVGSLHRNSNDDVLIYGQNHMPDKPCSICDKTTANTCSVKEETTEDTQTLITTVKCLSGSTTVLERDFTKPNPYPGTRIRRTHYESCGPSVREGVKV